MKKRFIINLFWFFTAAFIVSFSLFTTGCEEPLTDEELGIEQPAKDTNAVKILIIGNSLTFFNDMPVMFRKVIETNKMNVVIESITYPGAQLVDQVSAIQTDSKIKKRKWDYIILQEGYMVGFENQRSFIAADIRALKNKIIMNNPSTKILYFMSWCTLEDTFWQSKFYSFQVFQKMIYDGSLQVAKSIGVGVAPVGWVWKKVIEDKKDFNLYSSDGFHPSVLGSFLEVCVYYSCIFKEPVPDKEYFTDFSRDIARYIQTTSGDIVLNNVELWGIQ